MFAHHLFAALTIVIGLVLPVSTLSAANKALLIGATEYENPKHNLKGIDLDLETMSQVARKLGFEGENIRTLTGSDVTLANVEAQFSGFLNDDVLPRDSVLIYYSGHGVQVPDVNGDETDSEDEAITLYDLAGVYDSEKKVIWDGVLLDDRFSELLSGLMSENVVVIVDACHSGTVTRSYTGYAAGKTLAYGEQEFAVKSLGAPRVATRSFGPGESVIDAGSTTGVVTLSAAQDHQQALASSKGSLFTLALSESLDQYRENASPKTLVSSVAGILDERLDDDVLFHPNLTGDTSLFEKPIVLTDSTSRGEVNQQDLLRLVGENKVLNFKSSKGKYSQSEVIELRVDVPADGYINIIAVDGNDNMVVLFPNGLDTDNKVAAGTRQLPGKRDFSWAAQPPWGSTMIAVLFSEKPFNLFDISLQRNQNGSPLTEFVVPSVGELVSYQRQTGSKAAGVAFVKTCENASSANCE